MPGRHTVADTADLLPFLALHARSGLGAPPPFLITLSLTPGGVFDLHDEAGRALAAVLIDACDNSGDAAELLLLASRDAAPGEGVIALLLDAALAEARLGPRSHLEVTLDASMRPHRALLEARGFTRRFDIVAMERHGPWTAVEPPPGWTWATLSAGRYDEAARLVRAAFSGLPGVNFPPAGQGRAFALGQSPPVRLLLDGGRIAGWVSVRGESDGSGMVASLARHPGDRGRGLGAALLTEGLRQLEAAGLAPVRLDVVATNESALALYEGFGFRTTDTVSVHAVATSS